MKSIEREVLIIGAGPAGICAAIEARQAGCDVLVVDENDKRGGQLPKQIHKFFGSADHYAGMRGFEIATELCKEADQLGVEFWMNSVAFGIFPEGVGVVHEGKACLIQAKKTIVAAGGIENTVAFPGSTLPGIMTAGAAQTLANIHRVLPGKRVVVLGSGNVGLIVAYQLMQAGAEIVALVEKANEIGGYAVHAAKISRAGVPILTGHAVLRAEGEGELERVIIAKVDAEGKPVAGSEQTLEADTLCIAVGMSPMSELLWQAGAKFDYIEEFGGFVPLHTAQMETSIENLYVAGDVTGVEEASIAMEEGRLAGVSVSKALGRLEASDADRSRAAITRRIAALEEGSNRKAARYRQLADANQFV